MSKSNNIEKPEELLTLTPVELSALSDEKFQAVLLEGVSRTFALTIPQLPQGLDSVVANAYLLCRIVDTIEDEVKLTVEEKKHFCHSFIEVTNTGKGAKEFALELAPLLSDKTLPAEHTLIKLTERVIEITHSFDKEQIEALSTCVDIMAKGMPTFQEKDLHSGVSTMKDMDLYCYYVAGCVGEMLARLFCHHSPEINFRRDELMALAVSFSQGLQMTNILKDIWDDKERGVCWLPQEVFDEFGFDLKNLNKDTDDEGFTKGMEVLLDRAEGHLKDALTYTQIIPRSETGIRKFCLWAIGMAVLTIKKIRKNPNFKNSKDVKISRRQVKATILATNLSVRSNTLLSILFHIAK